MTAVPPATGPTDGVTPGSPGGGMAWNAAASVLAWASAFVSVTACVAAARTGARHVTDVPPTSVTPVAAVPPNATVQPAAKLLPVSVTTVPPAVGPEFGLTLVSDGAAPMYVKPLASVEACPSGLVTVTETGPIVPAGVVQVIWVVDPTTTLPAAAPPNVTVVVPVVWKLLPVSVTAVLPLVDPLAGETLPSDGGATAAPRG